MRLFSDPRCTCDPLHVAAAAFEQRELEPCQVHEANHVQRRSDADVMRDVLDTMQAGDELTVRRRNREADDVRGEVSFAAVDRTDPLLGALLRMTGAPIPKGGSTLPLGLPPSQYPALAGMTETTDFDGPDAA